MIALVLKTSGLNALSYEQIEQCNLEFEPGLMIAATLVTQAEVSEVEEIPILDIPPHFICFCCSFTTRLAVIVTMTLLPASKSSPSQPETDPDHQGHLVDPKDKWNVAATR